MLRNNLPFGSLSVNRSSRKSRLYRERIANHEVSVTKANFMRFHNTTTQHNVTYLWKWLNWVQKYSHSTFLCLYRQDSQQKSCFCEQEFFIEGLCNIGYPVVMLWCYMKLGCFQFSGAKVLSKWTITGALPRCVVRTPLMGLARICLRQHVDLGIF